MIHDQLPLAMPCYDFVPITELSLGRIKQISATPGSLDVTGGEYKVRERIQRGVADPRLLAIPSSWGRVADPNLNWGAVWCDWLHLAVSRHIVGAIVARV